MKAELNDAKRVTCERSLFFPFRSAARFQQEIEEKEKEHEKTVPCFSVGRVFLLSSCPEHWNNCCSDG
jgi:hypothetical protein